MGFLFFLLTNIFSEGEIEKQAKTCSWGVFFIVIEKRLLENIRFQYAMATLARLVTAFLALGLGKATLIFYLYYVFFEGKSLG